ncbi:DUF3854 domain-containing protein [Nodularia spumigena CS-586/05]|uniref:DUF3854 domain-containing protein n=1 Tax=Nodularia spumigena TaxID=70799 RepID=UPI00232E2CC9|nr:DUF3854 domain-containing protein [Nodularia spumigena]MDB9344570.1 DUF3854 domain-containing protein [Nodularia spumigena CS-588/06]MDB9370681.1 DUF3854 domain-containing protein [Nodularia spumigena CS-586/05]
MFDERSLNLVSSYVKTEETLVNNLEQIWVQGIVPLVKAIAERLQYEWEQRAKIELGQETYVMTPDGTGGWKWEKADPLAEEYDDVESDLWTTDTLIPSLSPATTQKILIGSSESEQEEQTLTTIVSSPPAHIDVEHWQETVDGSAIHPDIASRNFRSLHEDSIEQANEAWEYLMYSDKLERTNTGRLSSGMLRKYAHLEQGGWWCDAGVDPRSFADLQPGDKPERKLWGCFKPNEPRENSEKPGKKIKYENPPKTDLSIFLLDVPDDVAGRIYNKAGVDPSESDRASGFWYCVWKHNVPVTITEGAKKAASILSQGEAAIGLSGIYGGYRSRDEQGNPIPPKLHPELAVFATPGREMTFCFDYETRPKTVRNIELSTLRTAGLLESAGAKVSVIRLPGTDKGVDDFIVNNGADEFEVLVDQAEPLEEWHKQNQKIWDVKPKPIKKKLNQDQLHNIANKLVNNSPGDFIDPEDFRFTIFLKDGTARKLYEQKNETVHTNVVRENLTASEILNLNSKSRKKPVQSERNTTSPEINSLTFSDIATPEITHESSESIQYWAKPTDVPIFKQTIKRRFVEATENNYIALAAKQLLNNYGVEHDDSSFVYRSDAFSIREFRGTYSIHRHEDEQASYFANSLMQFQINPQGKVNFLKKPDQMLSVERQEFLMIADYLNHGQELPMLDLDTRELSNSLGSLAPQGTQKILESFRQGEILKVMHGTLSKAKSDEVKIGEYRIQSDQDTKAGKVFLRLFKQDKIGEKEKVRFELNRTPQGITNQIRIMTLDDHDLANLKQISKKLNIETPSRKPDSPANHHTTSPRAPGQTDSAYVCSPPANTRDISVPLHSELAKVWEQLENSVGWTSASNQGNNDLREKLQQDGGKLTIGEQRELYFKIFLQSKDEQLLRGKTEIILPPLQSILTDLKKYRRESIGESIDSTYTPNVRKIAKTQKNAFENEL